MNENTEAIPVSYISLEADWRLELLVGHLSDLLAPAQQLLDRLRLRVNASHASQSDLEFIKELQGHIWEHLDVMLRYEVKQIRAELKALREHGNLGAKSCDQPGVGGQIKMKKPRIKVSGRTRARREFERASDGSTQIQRREQPQ